MTPEQTIAVLVTLTTFFPNAFQVSDEAHLVVYHRELEPYEFEAVDLAARELGRTFKGSFPTLRDLLDRLGPPRPAAGTAWAELIAHAEKWCNGPIYRGGEVLEPPPLRRELAEAAKTLGDLRAIAYRSSAEDGVMRAHFQRAYDAQAEEQARASAREAIAPAPQPRRLQASTERRPGVEGTADIVRRMLPPGGAA